MIPILTPSEVEELSKPHAAAACERINQELTEGRRSFPWVAPGLDDLVLAALRAAGWEAELAGLRSVVTVKGRKSPEL